MSHTTGCLTVVQASRVSSYSGAGKLPRCHRRPRRTSKAALGALDLPVGCRFGVPGSRCRSRLRASESSDKIRDLSDPDDKGANNGAVDDTGAVEKVESPSSDMADTPDSDTIAAESDQDTPLSDWRTRSKVSVPGGSTFDKFTVLAVLGVALGAAALLRGTRSARPVQPPVATMKVTSTTPTNSKTTDLGHHKDITSLTEPADPAIDALDAALLDLESDNSESELDADLMHPDNADSDETDADVAQVEQEAGLSVGADQALELEPVSQPVSNLVDTDKPGTETDAVAAAQLSQDQDSTSSTTSVDPAVGAASATSTVEAASPVVAQAPAAAQPPAGPQPVMSGSQSSPSAEREGDMAGTRAVADVQVEAAALLRVDEESRMQYALRAASTANAAALQAAAASADAAANAAVASQCAARASASAVRVQSLVKQGTLSLMDEAEQVLNQATMQTELALQRASAAQVRAAAAAATAAQREGEAASAEDAAEKQGPQAAAKENAEFLDKDVKASLETIIAETKQTATSKKAKAAEVISNANETIKQGVSVVSGIISKTFKTAVGWTIEGVKYVIHLFKA